MTKLDYMLEDTFMTAGELARLYHLKPRTPYDARWRDRVGLRAHRVGRRLLFAVADVEGILVRPSLGAGKTLSDAATLFQQETAR